VGDAVHDGPKVTASATRDSAPPDWRPAIIRQAAIAVCVAGAGLVAAGLGTQTLELGSPIAIFAIVGCLASAWTLTPWGRGRSRVQAFVVVAFGAFGGLVAVWQVGAVMNAGIALLVSVLLAGALLDRRWAAGLLVFHGAALIAFGYAIETGWVVLQSPQSADPSVFANWVRLGIVFIAVTGAIVFALLAVVNQIDRARAEAWHMVEALRREQAERARLEAEREEARRAVIQAQHLESMGRFAGGVAHDFNNLLTVILATAGELEQAGDGRSREVGREITQAAHSAAALTKQLLAVGKRDLWRPEPIDVDMAIAALEKPIRRLLPEDVALVVDLHGEGTKCFVDPSHFQQVALNLAINARDAMPKGGILTISTARADLDTAPAMLLTVRDTGVGMSAELREHIFEPFFTTKDKGRGTGLGLASVYGIVQRAMGRITVDSEPGEGSTFRVWWPVGDEASAPADARAPGPSRPEIRSHLILVAEDEATVRAPMCRALERAGYETLEAKDGTEALSILRKNARHIALFCTDAIMPGVPLADVLAELRSTRPELPVLLCSGYVEEDLVRRDIEAGRGAFLQKPYSMEALVAAIDGLLRETAPDAQRSPNDSPEPDLATRLSPVLRGEG
jgi:signal transduction histidine kinase/FixJ family two-component response regulator